MPRRKKPKPVDVCLAIAVGLSEELVPPPGTKMGHLRFRDEDRDVGHACFCAHENVTDEQVVLGDSLWRAFITPDGIQVSAWRSIMDESFELEDPEVVDRLQYSLDATVHLWRVTTTGPYAPRNREAGSVISS